LTENSSQPTSNTRSPGMVKKKVTFLRRGQRGIFTEIYFPQRVAAQGTIFTALQEGYHGEVVKTYLVDHIDYLIEELQEHWHLLDPNPEWKRTKPTRDEVEKRIGLYKSPFFGWSNYAVGGVFWSKRKKMIEEATQIIRLMFLFNSKYVQAARNANCSDVLRAMIFWLIPRHVRLEERHVWHKAEETQFLAQHHEWSTQKEAFVHKYFPKVGQEIAKWMGDCFLFVFGYLVRQFSKHLTDIGIPEQEIWTTSFSNLTVTIMK
jgi:hypothetical protein